MSDFTSAEIAILKRLAAGFIASTGGTTAVATDQQLDSQYGDPKVFRDPPKWKGETCMGLTYSQCPSDYLEMTAGFLDWTVEKDRALPDAEQKKNKRGFPYWKDDEKRAALARGWAKRNAANGHAAPPPRPPPPADTQEDPDGIPF